MASKISAEEMLISECLNFGDKYYKIPDYQRRYSWGKEQWEDFWYDLTSLEYKNDEHFLGSIVVITGSLDLAFNKLELVDGQQRLTTIMVLLRSIADSFVESDDDNKNDIGKKIKKDFLKAENNRAETRLRLELGNLDSDCYKKLMNNRINNIEDSNLLDAYNFFKDKLSNLNLEEIQKVYDKLLGQMLVVLITSENEKSAFRLFETLNDRGLELSAIDLMKNYLLKVVVNDDSLNSELIKDKWENIIVNIQNINRKVRFFRHYIMSFKPITNKKVTQKKVYDRFKEIIDIELEKINYTIKDYIADMEEKSEIYCDIYSADISLFSDKDNSIINKKLKNLKAIGASPARTLVLKAIDEASKNNISSKDIIELLQLIEIFSIRRIIGQYSTGELDTIYNRLAVNSFNKDNPIDYIKQVFKDNIPGDDEFTSNFKDRNFRNNNQTKYILDKIEKEKYMASGTGKSINGRSEVHIEHIAPTGSFTTKKYKEWSSYFNMSKEEFEDLKTKIGNLTLFETKLNISASDKPFEQKKEKYKDSDFYMTQDLSKKYDSWKKKDILDRTEKLTEYALDIWSFK